MTDDLQRFITAQDAVLTDISAELHAGRKQTHWMWFVFPQLAGLGHSTTAKFFALRDLNDARRYLADPVLGTRLREHVRLLLQHKAKTAREILGAPDDLKFRSCLTLFMAASSTREDRELFEQGLHQFYAGKSDPRTLELIREH
jgi:uncharacterized protein (DUF1810 family)